ncbi:MAG: glucosamine-6-phosphate deaminase [bacterium]
MEVIITKDYDEMSRVAANIIRDLILRKPNCVLGLATGGTPEGTYAQLVKYHRENGLDFSKVTTFNLDEYLGFETSNPGSYHFFMHDKLFNHVNAQPEKVHVLSGIAPDPAEHCVWYEAEIKKAGGIDLQLLGIGPDGHIAFNEPFSSLASRTRMKTLDESTIEANARFFHNKKELVPKYCLTMGVGTILEARRLLMVVNGKKKAKITAEFIEGPVTSKVTASALQLHPDAVVVLDEDAASALNPSTKAYFKWVYDNKPGRK